MLIFDVLCEVFQNLRSKNVVKEYIREMVLRKNPHPLRNFTQLVGIRRLFNKGGENALS